VASTTERDFSAAPLDNVSVISPPGFGAGSMAVTRWLFMMSTP
jgi:hypothetical protein